MEIWKSIDGYPEYIISNLGRVKSMKFNKERILKQFKDSSGYYCIELNLKSFKIHRLVALAFIPNPDNKPQIDHINRKRDDNKIENLRWVTHQENMTNKTITYNQDVRIDNKIQEKCITLRFDNNKYSYRVRIKRNKEYVYDKTYKTLEDAIKARDEFLRDNK